MTSPGTAPKSPLQQRTLRLFGELLCRMPADGWPGKLILTAGEGSSATGLPAAACIAGATCLVLDPDMAHVRATFRDAGLDFIVNSLDEAIRILKNEIRQRRPLAVAITTSPTAALAEAHERGLLANLAVNAPGSPSREHLQLNDLPTSRLQTWLNQRGWQQQAVPTGASQPDFPHDDPRQTWLRQLPRYQRSATREPRLLWLNAEKSTAAPAV